MKLPRAAVGWSVFFVALVLLQLPLLLNPGYFSHDELQWSARADVPGWASLPWVSWTDVGTFQYRPLTFNLWLLFSYAFFATPFLMHAVFVGLGGINAVLLGRCIEAGGATRRSAMAAAAIFVLSPFVAYVHGWVGTLADLLTLLMALFGLHLLQGTRAATGGRDAATTGLVLAAVCVALLCKESAIVLPAALLPALYRHPRPRAAFKVIALACVPVLVYLALRLPTLLSPPAGGESYAWAIGNVPRRFAEYLLFPFLPPMLEVGPALAKSGARLLAAAACLAAVLAALAARGGRWPVAWLALYAALLAPVLVLATSYGQYAYLASAAAIGIAAAAWSGLRSAPRLALAFAAAVTVAHGAAVMKRMREIGVVQQHFHADLTALLAAGADAPRIALADEGDRWMAARFVGDVPTYRGATLAGPGETAPLVMRSDGHVVRAEP